jgi:hypothetical protein
MNKGQLIVLILIVSTALSIPLGYLITAVASTPKKQRHHLYYCQDPRTGISLPCMYRKNDPVDV